MTRSTDDTSGVEAEADGPSKNELSAVVFALASLTILAGATVMALDFDGRAGIAPLTIGIPASVLAAAVVAHEAWKWRGQGKGVGRQGSRTENASWGQRLLRSPYLWLLLYAVCFYTLGAVAALVVFSISLMRIRGRQRWRITLTVTAATALGFFLVTEIALGESLYDGVLLAMIRGGA